MVRISIGLPSIMIEISVDFLILPRIVPFTATHSISVFILGLGSKRLCHSPLYCQSADQQDLHVKEDIS